MRWMLFFTHTFKELSVPPKRQITSSGSHEKAGKTNHFKYPTPYRDFERETKNPDKTKWRHAEKLQSQNFVNGMSRRSPADPSTARSSTLAIAEARKPCSVKRKA